MAVELGYRMFDADNHLYEGTDAFTRHLDTRHRHEFQWVSDDRGRRYIILHGKFWPYIGIPTFDPVSIPGTMELMYRGKLSKKDLGEKVPQLLEPLSNRPEYMNRDARVARLDEQGIEACWLFPTMVSGVEQQTEDDLDVTYALIDALNQWLLEEWSFHYHDRMFVTPAISLADPVRAQKQLEFAIEHGARGVMMRPAPVHTESGPRSPGRQMFDGFWGLAAEAGIAIMCHAGDTGYQKYAGDWTGHYEMQPYKTSIPQTDWIYIEGRAPSDFILSLIAHGVFDRFPRLQVASIESGGHWVPGLINSMKKYFTHYPESFFGDPIAQFNENVWISPFWEDDIDELARVMPVEHIIAGSDWPHPEGLADPTDFVKGLSNFSELNQRKIMRENGLKMVGKS
jgi:predicted TIM-barrel fold metal-dependent hydrolase